MVLILAGQSSWMELRSGNRLIKILVGGAKEALIRFDIVHTHFSTYRAPPFQNFVATGHSNRFSLPCLHGTEQTVSRPLTASHNILDLIQQEF